MKAIEENRIDCCMKHTLCESSFQGCKPKSEINVGKDQYMFIYKKIKMYAEIKQKPAGYKVKR